nr:hypothetical protein [Tanacetum cinerariifolium]
MKNVLKGLVKTQVKEQVSRILPRVEESVNATLEAEVLTRSSHSSRTSYAVVADLLEMELKKILIEKMEGNRSIQRSDEQRNLYKALVEAYEADKAILDTYRESTILARRREDNDQEGPSAGPNRGSKRQREGGEQTSASTPSERATKGAGGSTTGTQSRQQSTTQPYYVTHPSSVIDYKKDYQGKIQGNAQEEKVTTTMMLLALVITQHDYTPTNNHVRTSSNTRNRAVIFNGRVDIQSKNVGYAGNGNRNTRRLNKNQIATEQMLMAMKDEAGGNLNEEENHFMVGNAYEDDTLKELNVAVIMMAYIQQTANKADAKPKHDVETISEVNVSQINPISGMRSKVFMNI